MLPFRTIHPVRRNIVTDVPSHSAHRADLRLDFNQRCGYCNDWDYYKTTYYEIDHFVPEDVMVTITNTSYSNLVYSCRSCNNAKRAKWPSKDELIAIVNDEGFVDPCDGTYIDHFDRDDDGAIVSKTTLGKWIYTALKFSKRHHQIIYTLEKLDEAIEELKAEIVNRPELQNDLNGLFDKYHRISHELRGL